MIKRIKIEGYKSLEDVEVELAPLSVLVGPNAAGKSNFLDALQLLSRAATSRTLKEAFEPPYRGSPLESFTFGPDGVTGLLAQETASLNIEVDIELSPAVINAVNRQIREMKKTKNGRANSGDKSPSYVREPYLRYRIEIEIRPKSGILCVADEYLAALNSKGEPSGKRRPFLERVKNRLHLRLEGQAHPTYYERYLDRSILSLPMYPPHYPHLVAMRQEMASWFFFYFEPRERMRAPNSVKEVRHIGLMGEELASFLNTLRALDEPQFKAVEKALHMIVPSVTGIDVGVNNLGEVELKLLEGKTPIPARVLSEGTLRILGLLALGGAKEPTALLGFEEPENGVHPRRLSLIAEMLKTRARGGNTQLIVTTHSPVLLDFISVESLFVCRREQGRTRIEPLSTKPLWKDHDIDKALNAEDGIPVSERILRGDFDA
ncbi:MAG: AAA family ATPase [Blastocatellia bacterium]|nr:AAA family ATPase [Blastocatellia bacterium]